MLLPLAADRRRFACRSARGALEIGLCLDDATLVAAGIVLVGRGGADDLQ